MGSGPSLPKPGERLAGYTLERVLGRGGMGAVFVGVSDAGARRAIKVPLFEGEGAEALCGRSSSSSRICSGSGRSTW